MIETKIIKSLRDAECDQAAINAIKAIRWRPAKAKGKSVSLWVSIPVRFKLKYPSAASCNKTLNTKTKNTQSPQRQK